MSGGTRRAEAGFSYMEVLIATALVALALLPALEALQIGIDASGIHARELARHQRVRAKLEEVLARPFAELEGEWQAAAGAPSSYSDVTGPDRRIVWLAGYDADGDTHDDDGVLRVSVSIESTEHWLETLVAR